jgi:16S rRNA (guanine(966)-N(2))-methyltransferase RsmD
MRVITGSARGRKLKEVPGDTTRPITDRAKEALFSILGDWIIDARLLDLFGGTGAVGIEALSRGAAHAIFVEIAGPAYRVIQENLTVTQLADRATVIKGDAFHYLAGAHPQPFDVIYVAPPQYQGLWLNALRMIDERPEMLTDDGVVIVQIFPKEYEEIPLTSLEGYDERRYGGVLLCFYQKAGLAET